MPAEQYDLPFDEPFSVSDSPELWTPREVWVKFSQRMIPFFGEDRRVEYKTTPKLNWDDLACYFGAYSNSPDGGVLCIGVADNGTSVGCKNLSEDQLNRLEKFHVQKCPNSKPEIKRVPIMVEDQQDFLVLIYVPYCGRLVETNKGEAWIRLGDSKHKMSEEEKRDFRSTRNETSFELQAAAYKYPDEFDRQIIQDFCDEFRKREFRKDWTNEEILIDRHLLNQSAEPLNSLVLLAAKDVGRSIPGCRVRVPRFEGDSEGTGNNYNPVRDRFAEGNIVEIITKASSAIEEALNNVTWLDNNGRFVNTPEYPRWAWFESLVNACVHRSYEFSGTDITIKIFSNRMVIESPGGFVPPVNERTIYSMRASRNHHTMDALRFLGYVPMAREGTKRIRESMAEYNLPEPEFKQESVHGVVVRVTLTNDHESQKRSSDGDVARFFGVEKWKLLQEHEIKIIAFAFRNQTIQVTDAQRLTGRTWGTSKKDLERLCRKDFLVFVPGQYVRDAKAHYRINEGEQND
jgi:ATP-dependent DNA helicase RecG